MSKLTAITLAISLGTISVFGLEGCTKQVPEPVSIERPWIQGNVHGSKDAFVTQERNKHKYETHTFYGTEHYIEEDTRSLTGFNFSILNDTLKGIQVGSQSKGYGGARIIAQDKYILQKAQDFKDNAEALRSGAKDEFTDWVKLNVKTNVNGVLGVRANVTCTDQLREQLGIPLNSSGWVAIRTEQHMRYEIATRIINGIEYFYPHVENSRTNDKEALPFYLIPVAGSELRINHETGEIIIHHENNILRPYLAKTANISTQGGPGAVEKRGVMMSDGEFSVVVPIAEKAKSQESRIYIIQSGDTLGKIATKEGITLQELLKLNPLITDKDIIFEGKKLTLPNN